MLFVRRQNRSATPMLDMGLFSYAPFSASILANFLSIVGLIGFIFFISQHLQLVLGLSPLAAGLVTLPGAVVSMIAGLAVVKAAKRFAADKLMIFGLVFVAAGFGLILAFRHDLSVAAVIASFVVLELGVGVSQTVSNDTIVASVPAAKAGAASGSLGDRLRAGRRGGHRDARHDLHGVLPQQHPGSGRTDPGAGRRRR